MARIRYIRARKPPKPRIPAAARKVSRREGNELLRRIQERKVATGLMPTFPPTQNYDHSEVTRLGVVMETGPNGEPDFTDHRYWLALAIADNNENDATLPTKIIRAAEAYRRKTIVATNLAEAAAESHTVPMGTAVVIDRVYDVRARDRYYFHSGASASLQQFRILALGGDGDTLLCRTWDGAEEGTEDVAVLLPHELRKSRYNGKAEELLDAASGSYVTVRYVAGPTLLTRTAFIDAQSYSEQQIITPQYVTAAHGGSIGPTIVVAVSRASVAGGLGQPPDTPEEERREWMVQDARAWAEVWSQGTAQGIVQRMIERRGGGERA